MLLISTTTNIDLARWTHQQCREKCRELGLTSTGLHSQLRYRLSKWRTSQPDVTGHPGTATPPDAPAPPPRNAQLVPSPFADYAPPPPPPPDDRLLSDGSHPKRSTEPPPNPVPTTRRRRMQRTDHSSPDETSETHVDDSDTETPPSTSVRRRRRQPPPTATTPTMDLPAVQFSTTISDPTDNGTPSHAPKDAALPDAACRRLRALSDRPTELELAQLRDTDLRALLATSLILIGADCNGHSSWWGPPETITNAVGSQMEDFILQEGLSVANRWPCPPTFTSKMGFQTWIDITLTSSSLATSVSDWHVLSEVYLDSDHSALTYTLRLNPHRSTETRLDWRHVPWDSFRQSLQSELHSHFLSLPEISSTSDLDSNVTNLTTAFQTTIQAHVPVKHVSAASHPWWSPHLSSLRRDHLRARRRWKRTRTPEDRRALNTSKRALRNAIIDAKRHSWRQFCENTSPMDVWKSFKKVSRLSPSRTIQPLVHEGVQHFSAADQAEVLADRFFTPTMTPLTAFHHRIQSEVETLLSEIHTIPSHPITQPEIRQAISQSGPWKAPGRDGVPYICFKQCISLVLPILQHLFTASLLLGHVPAFWKVATVVAVPKPGETPSLLRDIVPSVSFRLYPSFWSESSPIALHTSSRPITFWLPPNMDSVKAEARRKHCGV